MQRKLIIGTRGSPLALYQANLVKRLLKCESKIKVLITSGDTIKGELKHFGGKGLFTKELEAALMDGRIDLAVHSMKDVPTVSQDELAIGAILERVDPRDAFISKTVSSLADLPPKAVVGTASIRRRAQLSALRPDIRFTLLRGNVGTRLNKLDQGECEATFLACAGLKRLGQESVITEAIDPAIMLPAPAQGAIGIEVHRGNQDALEAIRPLNHGSTEIAITAERAFLRELDGSCRTPIAALAIYESGKLSLQGEVLSGDGTQRFSTAEETLCNSLERAADFGESLGKGIRVKMGGRVLWDA